MEPGSWSPCPRLLQRPLVFTHTISPETFPHVGFGGLVDKDAQTPKTSEHLPEPLFPNLPQQNLPKPPITSCRWLFEAPFDKTLQFGSSIAVATVAFGSRPLSGPYPDTGRGTVPRNTCIGYVAISKVGAEGLSDGGAVSVADGAEAPVEVVFVWRGTTFKEEWVDNFAKDKLVRSGGITTRVPFLIRPSRLVGVI